MPHPLELPEIRDLIGAYLDAKDLFNCACVSREWNSTFSTLIWQHLDLKPGRTWLNMIPLNPTVAQIQAHSSHVRSLTITTDIPNEYYLLEHLHRLHSIYVKYKHYSVSIRLDNLIENHSSSLKNIGIRWENNYLSLRTLKAFGRCHQLKSLSLNGVHVTQEEFTALLDACANVGRGTGEEVDTNAISKHRVGGLTTLCLERVGARHGQLVLSSTLAPLSRLEHLHGENLPGMGSDSQLKLLVLCPNLRSLYWRCSMYGQQFLIDEWVGHIESRMWPLLTSLNVSGEEFHDKGLSRFIDSSHLPLEKFLVERTGFGPLAYNSMISTERHYNHIQELDIYGCTEVESHMIQKFMTTMPTLRYFSAGHLRATDILDAPSLDRDGDDRGQEWVCKNIRTLRLCIDMGLEFDPSSSEYAERQRRVYLRFSELRFLEVLDVGRELTTNGHDDDSGQRLDLKLRAGLEHLASLDRIREFLFAPQKSMTFEEIEWMI
ncbi:hypothetical protein BGX26_005774, partial [Mortierella sp. AD094]